MENAATKWKFPARIARMPIRPGAKFCLECGHDLRKPIEAKPVNLQQPTSYTPKHLADKILNTRSSIEGERKIVTVMFADVTGSTALFENLDPEEMHEVMDGCFQIFMDEIHKYEGTINQFLGDGVMASVRRSHIPRGSCATSLLCGFGNTKSPCPI